MVSGFCDIDTRKEIGGLSGGGEDGPHTAFQIADLRGCGIYRRVLQPGVEVAAVFQVEEAGHLVGCFIFESGALDNGELPGFAFLGGVPCVYAAGSDFCHMFVRI